MTERNLRLFEEPEVPPIPAGRLHSFRITPGAEEETVRLVEDGDNFRLQVREDWWTYYENIILLVHYLAEVGWQAEDIAYAVEKPWKYFQEFSSAIIDTHLNGDLVERHHQP